VRLVEPADEAEVTTGRTTSPTLVNVTDVPCHDVMFAPVGVTVAVSVCGPVGGDCNA
jgi:hypothetical protein